MSLLIGFLTFILVVDCLFLMLLVLIQLPKKEAGASVAFGGMATDALFGAGSGNVLTKLTKYTAALFLALGVLIAFLHARQGADDGFERALEEKAATTTAPAPSAAPQPLESGTEEQPALSAPEAGITTPEPESIAPETVPGTTAPAPATETPAAPNAQEIPEANAPAAPGNN